MLVETLKVKYLIAIGLAICIGIASNVKSLLVDVLSMGCFLSAQTGDCVTASLQGVFVKFPV